MTELTFLIFFIAIGVVIAPLMTNKLFLGDSKLYGYAHKVVLVVMLAAVLMGLNNLIWIWPLFCAFGFFLFLRNENKALLSITGIAGCIPFAFSLISSVWLVAGANDLYLLGYDRFWSFYASLHGSFLGWMLIGSLAFLARRSLSPPMYPWGCFLGFATFLLVAIGINGIPYAKRIGVIGLTILMPFMIGQFAFSMKDKSRSAYSLALLSLGSIAVTITLAVLHEFWVEAPLVIFDLPIMVVVHGSMNALITIPCFLLAIQQGTITKLRVGIGAANGEH